MKTHKDKLAGFGIEAAIQHALTLNEEADNADMIILSCGVDAWYQILAMESYIYFAPHRFAKPRDSGPIQYIGATGFFSVNGKRIIVVPDSSKADKVFVIHDEDYQWSVSTIVD